MRIPPCGSGCRRRRRDRSSVRAIRVPCRTLAPRRRIAAFAVRQRWERNGLRSVVADIAGRGTDLLPPPVRRERRLHLRELALVLGALLLERRGERRAQLAVEPCA